MALMPLPRVIAIAFVIAGLSVSVFSKRSESAEPVTEEYIEKGRAAVLLKDYSLAADYFDRARKHDPLDPDILFNQALAEALAGERDLRAIVLFNAYLALRPDSPDGAAIRSQIRRAEVSVESAAAKLIARIPDLTSASRFPAGSFRRFLSSDALLPALLGKYEEARALANGPFDFIAMAIAAWLRNDFPEAIRVAKSAHEPSMELHVLSLVTKSEALGNPVQATLHASQIKGMLQLKCCKLDEFRELPWADAFVALMRAYVIAGDAKNALETERQLLPLLESWRGEIAEHHSTNEERSNFLYFEPLAKVYRKLAHLEAVATLGNPELARGGLASEFTKEEFNSACREAADWAAKRGDIEGTRRSLRAMRAPTPDQRVIQREFERLLADDSARKEEFGKAEAKLWLTYLDQYLRETSYNIPSQNISEPYDVLSAVEKKSEQILKWLYFTQGEAVNQARACGLTVCEAVPPP